MSSWAYESLAARKSSAFSIASAARRAISRASSRWSDRTSAPTRLCRARSSRAAAHETRAGRRCTRSRRARGRARDAPRRPRRGRGRASRASSTRYGSPVRSTSRDGVRLVLLGWVAPTQLAQHPLPLGVPVRDRDLAKAAVLLDHVDDAVVGEPRDQQGGELGERRLEVEPRRERVPVSARKRICSSAPRSLGDIVEDVDHELDRAGFGQDRRRARSTSARPRRAAAGSRGRPPGVSPSASARRLGSAGRGAAHRPRRRSRSARAALCRSGPASPPPR